VQTLSPDFKEKTMNLPATMDAAFITEVKQLIHAAKQRAVVAVNAELTYCIGRWDGVSPMKCCKANERSMVSKLSWNCRSS
jgi:hypothetical protein